MIVIKKEKKPLRLKLYYLFMCFFVLLIAVVSFEEFSKANALSIIEKKYTLQLEREKLNNINLQNELDFINTDTYIEKAAREKLGLIKQNEIIYFKK